MAPGKAVELGLRLRLAPGWHGYWRNPGDAGAPPEIRLLASCDRVVFLGPDGCLTSTHAGLVADPAYAELVLR